MKKGCFDCLKKNKKQLLPNTFPIYLNWPNQQLVSKRLCIDLLAFSSVYRVIGKR